MSAGLQLRDSTSLIPLKLQVVDGYFDGFAIRLQKTASHIGSRLFNLTLQSNARVVLKTSPAWIAVLVMLLVVLIHVSVLLVMMSSQSPQAEMQKSAAPMTVSIIAPPAPEVTPEPELVPIIAPVKVTKKPKLKPKKVVKKIVPVEVATQPVVEATTAPVIEDTMDEEETAAPAPATVVEVASEPVVVEEKIEPPKFGVSYLNNPAPSYPRFSRRAGEEGRVLLKVLVTAEGDAEAVEINKSSGFKRLDSAALKAVKRWRFVPARKGPVAVSAYVLVPVKFSLGN